MMVRDSEVLTGDLGERPKYFDEMLKLFSHTCFSARGKVEGVQRRVESG
jgi:hypothetical protein